MAGGGLSDLSKIIAQVLVMLGNTLKNGALLVIAGAESSAGPRVLLP